MLQVAPLYSPLRNKNRQSIAEPEQRRQESEEHGVAEREPNLVADKPQDSQNGVGAEDGGIAEENDEANQLRFGGGGGR